MAAQEPEATLNAPLPMFSIIVPTCGRPERLWSCLEALTRLDYPHSRFEVIVVDDGSPRPPLDAVEHFQSSLPLRLSVEPRRGVSAARNAGAMAARGQYLAFTADDCIPASGWLRALARTLMSAETTTGVAGAIQNGCPHNRFAAATHLLLDYLCHTDRVVTAGPPLFFTPNNLAVPVDGFHHIGGFDVSFSLSAGEDRDFCARWTEHGFALVRCGDAEVTHHHPLSFFGFLRTHWRYGRGSGCFARSRARRLGTGWTLQPVGFYARLVLHPIHLDGMRGIPSVMLLGVAQVVNALGVLREWLRPAPPSDQHL